MQTASSIHELIEKIKSTGSKLSKVLAQDDSRQCCFCVGLTGAGKSTFICHMCGVKLTCEGRFGKFHFNHNDPAYPKIGHTAASCTTIPGFYTARNGIVMLDAPGFLATTGVIQEILDSYCNAKMFKVGSRAKIIIVVEWFTLYSGRGGVIIDLAAKLQQLFGDYFNEIITSCIMVVTKIDYNNIRLEDIKGILNDIAEANVDFTPEARLLLETLLRFERILCFPVPTQINDEVIDFILSSIDSIEGYPITHEPEVALSPRGKYMIDQLGGHLEKERVTMIERLGYQIVDTFKKEIYDKKILEDHILRIKSAKGMILAGELQSGMPDKIQKLQELLFLKPDIIQKLQQWITQIKFCLTIHPKMRINDNLTNLLMLRLSQLQADLQKSLTAISTQEEIQKMNKQHQQSIQKQTENFKKQFVEANKKSEQRLEKMRKQAEENNKVYMNRLAQNNKQHMEKLIQMSTKADERVEKIRKDSEATSKIYMQKIEQNNKNYLNQVNQITKLNSQITELKNRKPEIVQKIVYREPQKPRCKWM